jgi:ABC-type antimicrobial peptide transport system permease subunit
VGLLLAIVVGLGLGMLWVNETFTYLLGWALEMYVPYADLAFVLLATAAVCYGAAILPGRRAASLAPVDALRYE